MAYQMSGTVRMEADGAVGASGKPIRIWNAHMRAAGAPVPTLYLHSGTAATDLLLYDKSGTASDTFTVSFGNGLRFPNGCYYEHSTLATYTTFEYEVEL